MTQNTGTGIDILAEVASTLKSSSETVKKRLVDTLVEREVVNRVDMLDKALVRLKDAKKEFDKIKPDVDSFDADGKLVSSLYSKAKADERKKAGELKEKLEKAIDQALSGESFDKLRELVK